MKENGVVAKQEISDNQAWPGAFGIFKRAAAATRINLWPLLGLFLLSILTSAVLSGFDKTNLRWLAQLFSYLIGILLQLALVFMYLAGVHGQQLTMYDSIKQASERYVDGFIAILLSAVLIIGSVLALIVPFFFVLPRLILVPYFVVDKQLGPIEAIKASWNESQGHSLKVWGAIAVSILFAVLMLVVVGIYLTFIYQTVFALLYLYITGQPSAKLAASGAPTRRASSN